MSRNLKPGIFPLAPAHLIGLGAFQLASILAFIDPILALWPLSAFVLLMLLAPMVPGWRLLMPLMTRVADGSVVLTFDDGPDPETTPKILALLERYDAKAVFFLVGKKVHEYPDLVKKIMQAGHEVGNHTMEHDVLIALKPLRRLRKSIEDCQTEIQSLGFRPRIFRPPAWIVRPGLWRVLLEQGMSCVGSRVKAMDFGNRRISGMARRVLKKVRPGDIVSLHDTSSPSRFSASQWLDELEQILEGLASKNLRCRTISSMWTLGDTEDKPGVGAVRFFYDSLAAYYDKEQKDRKQSALRTAEYNMVQTHLDKIVNPDAKVLEIGAGTGRFTIELAARAGEVTALDLSPAMIEKLKEKASRHGLKNIMTMACDIYEARLEGPFDLICSFSSLEYIADLQWLLRRLSEQLSPNGKIFFTTAHAGLARFFTQIGNAMRQGVWLHARRISEIKRLMAQANLEVEEISSFGPFGMLLSAQGRKPERIPPETASQNL